LLARRYINYARTVAHRLGYSTPLNSGEDMGQEALHGLHSAIRYYQPGRGMTFRTFTTMCVRRWLYTVVKNDTRMQRHSDVAPLRLDAPLADQHGARTDDSLDLHDAIADPAADVVADVVELLDRRERVAAVARVIDCDLSPLESACCELFIDGYTYVEIEERIVADGIDRRPSNARAAYSATKVVDNALTRARRKIAAALEDEGLAA
jgi:RNA polymerase sporulation-specific sigma factor